MLGPVEPRREQRLIFGEVAETYDRRRPSYPDGLISDVLEFADLRPGARALEVGAGTGKATVSFAGRGLTVQCLEPSPEMAAVARRNLARLPNATVLESSYEDWADPDQAIELIYSAQAWHWVSPAARYAKSAQVLRHGGTLALLWNVGSHRDKLERALDRAYGEVLDDDQYRRRRGHLASNDWVIEEIDQSGLFDPVTVVRHRWHAQYGIDVWLELLLTHSDHRMLDEETRARLFDRIALAVSDNGAVVDVDYVASGYLTRLRTAAGPEPSPGTGL